MERIGSSSSWTTIARMRCASRMRAHAMEYVAQAGQATHEQLPCPEELTTTQERTKFKQAWFQQWLKHQRHSLKTWEASKVLAELSRFQTLMQERHVESAVETITKKLAYVHERQAMLTYATFQAQGYPIGSGSVESANKLVVQSRMKGAGMRWFPAHVNAMLALRNLACRPIGAKLAKRSVVPDNY